MKNKGKTQINEYFQHSLDYNEKNQLFFEKNNIPYLITKNDIASFNLVLKAMNKNKRKILNILYKSKNSDNCKKPINLQKHWCKKQISLYFIYFYEYYDDRIFYDKLFYIMTHYLKNNCILDDNDILEIIHYNILFCSTNIISLEKLFYNKNTTFNILLRHFVQIITNDLQTIKTDIVFNILNSIYQLLSKNKELLFDFQNNDNSNNISLIELSDIKNILYLKENKDNEEITKIKNIINDILHLIYGFNLNKSYTDYLLKNLRNSFIELKGKDYSKEKIINSLYKLNNQINSINELIIYEDNIMSKKNEDEYMPKRYYIFNNSKESSINYSPNMYLTYNDFMLIFSFKQFESEENKVYPLITFTNNLTIIFGIYLKNKKISLYFQNDHEESADIEIILNKSYLVIIKYTKNNIRNDIVELYINGEEPKVINSGKIKYKFESNVNIGYLPTSINKKKEYENSASNYIGIIGSILFFNHIIEEKDFYDNIFKLKGIYDNLININSNVFIYNDAINQEIYSLKEEIKNYFIKSKLVEDYLLFFLSPIFLKNEYKISNYNDSEYYNNKTLKEKINENNFNKGKENKDYISSSLEVPHKDKIIPVYEIPSVYNFIQNEGFSIITLHLEYLYNILKMLISLNDEKENDNNDKSSLYYHITRSIDPLFILIYNIMRNYSNIIFHIKDSLDTIGFSLFKIFKIIISKTPLNSDLFSNYKQFIINLNKIYIRTKNKDSRIVILNIINKMLIMICDIKFFDLNNYKNFIDYLRLFKLVIKNNDFLINSQTLDLILNFRFIFDKKKFENNTEYKLLKSYYKDILMMFIGQMRTIKLHYEYIQKVCNNEENSFLMKYKLIKIYYINTIIRYVFIRDNDYEDDTEERTLLNKIFGRDKITVYKIIKKEKLFKEYKIQFKYLINYNNNKIKEEEKKYFELLKCIFIQLIYEQAVLVIPSKLNINYLEANLLLSDIEISFFRYDDIMNSKIINGKPGNLNDKDLKRNSLDDNPEKNIDLENFQRKMTVNNDFCNKNIISQMNLNKAKLTSDKTNLNTNEKLKTNNRKIYGLFDELIIYEDDEILKNENQLNKYLIKSLFGCFYDTWKKDSKLKFIKDQNDTSYKSYNMCINDFNRFKQKLFFQFIHFLEYIQNPDLFETIIKLVFCFINQSLTTYKSNQNEINSRRSFIHLIENKRTMKYLLNICLNNNDKIINNPILKLYVDSMIKDIISDSMVLHPNPFIFSYIKSYFKNNQKFIKTIIKNINDFIIDNLNNNEINTNNKISISFFLFNIIRYINLIRNCLKKYKKNAQILLCEDNYFLFNSLKNIIKEYTKSSIIYDSKIYTYNPNSLIDIYNENIDNKYNEEEKNKDKQYIRSIRLTNTKIINHEELFITIFDLSFQIIYILWTIQKPLNDLVTQINLNDFISHIINCFYVKEHFISYYIDIKNCFFTYNQPRKHDNLVKKLPKEINEMIEKSLVIKPEYNKYFLQNPYIKDNRLATAIVFILFMKYFTKIINYEFKYVELEEHDDVEKKVKEKFNNFDSKANRDLIEIYYNINKIKEDKKLEYFYEIEENSPKDNLHKSLRLKYDELLNIIKKIKINTPLDSFVKHIREKYIKEADEEEEEDNKDKELFMEKYSSGSNNYTPNEEKYNVEINNTEENNMENNEGQQNKNEIIRDYYTTIEKTNNNNNKINDYSGNDDDFEIINNDYNYDDNNYFSNYITDVKNQILCTKRDLILKNFGYYFYDDYFKDTNFINLRRKYLYIYSPDLEKNNYNNLEKQMTLKFPSTIKNFSNTDIYYPKIFLRPDKHFFKNSFYKVGHAYFNEYKNLSKPNYEYGHGLLNQDNFELFEISKDKKEKPKNYNISTPCYEAELISSKNNIQGNVVLKEKYLVFQTNMNFDFNKYKNDVNYILSSKIEDFFQTPKQILIPYKLIKQIIKRKFIFFDQAFELYLYNGKSYYFNLYKDSKNTDFFNKIEIIKNEQKNNFEIIRDLNDYFFQKKYTSNWLDKKISTLEYLLQINKFSGRSYNDLSQYLILPWTLKDYLDINDKKYIRDFSLPMSVQEKSNLEIIKHYYNMDDNPNKSYFTCHYSNSAYITIYLFRINPFSNNQIKLQSGHYDNPKRQIANLQVICNIFKENKETCELIPEYYFLIESFLNINYNFFGFLDVKTKSILNNLKLTKDFDSLLELFLFHQNFLNSDQISSLVHKWIDNIYGENQITDKKNVINSYPFECYEQNVKGNIEDRIKELKDNINKNKNIQKEIHDIRGDLMITYLLGQCPSQLFKKSHPQYQAKNIENNYNKISIKNEMKKLTDSEFLYMNENIPMINNSESNYFYILTDKNILVFNKQIKQLTNLTLNNIKKFHPIFQSNYISKQNKEKEKTDVNSNKINDNNINLLYCKQYFYKRLIFEIEECKFFFIGGYLDNSFQIYFRNKDNTICYNYITNSIITCMKYMKKTNIYFTGHINGQIIKWKYNVFYKGKDLNINCNPIYSLTAHKSGVSLIQIHDKLELLLSSSDKDGIIFIRKLFDFELLSVIKYNNLSKQLMDIIIDKEYFIVTYNYKKINNKIIQNIVTYSVNGIKLENIKISADNDDENNIYNSILLPICIQQSNDNIFMISKNKINLMKITRKKKIELVPIDEIMLKNIWKGKSNIQSDFIKDFNDKFTNCTIISYFYDFNNHILYCLFNDGHLYRVNVYPTDFIKNYDIISN